MIFFFQSEFAIMIWFVGLSYKKLYICEENEIISLFLIIRQYFWDYLLVREYIEFTKKKSKIDVLILYI